MIDNRPVSYSGVQPSGNLTIGNYLGAIKNFPIYSEQYKCFYCVVDQHAITVRQVPAELRRRTYETIALYIACGLDPEKNTLYVQSHVPAHTEMAWMLNCFTMFGELSRMTQFKDKSQKHADNVNAGLFTYPVLMAADILLYQTNVVPIGADQKQHLELARDIAERFNGLYGEVFKVPEPYIGKKGARILSLQEPEKKMSKSDPNVKSFISLADEPSVIAKKIKSAVTDSEARVYYGDGKAGINNLMNIYSCCTGLDFDAIEKEFEGRGYGDFKAAVAEAVVEELRPIQEEYKRILSDKAYIEACAKQGAEKASYLAHRTMRKVMKKVGFYQV